MVTSSEIYGNIANMSTWEIVNRIKEQLHVSDKKQLKLNFKYAFWVQHAIYNNKSANPDFL